MNGRLPAGTHLVYTVAMTKRLERCSSCGRHRFLTDVACPFCSSRAAVIGVALAAAGCAPAKTPPPEPPAVNTEVEEEPGPATAPAAADTDAPTEAPVEAEADPEADPPVKPPPATPEVTPDPETGTVEAVRPIRAVYGPPPPREPPEIKIEAPKPSPPEDKGDDQE